MIEVEVCFSNTIHCRRYAWEITRLWLVSRARILIANSMVRRSMAISRRMGFLSSNVAEDSGIVDQLAERHSAPRQQHHTIAFNILETLLTMSAT